MYKTKKDLDTHVRNALSKVGSEAERNLRGFTIAKLYYKKNEYATAEQYLCSYLSVKEDSDQAHKLLGQCYQHLKKPDKALKSFQRSLQLNAKQPDVLAEVCQLLLEDKNLNTNQAKYWCELAESEKVKHDAVFSLRLKLMNKDNLEVNQVEDIIQKEIASRPNDVQLRVRLLRNYIEQNKINDAFKYVFNLEMTNNDAFSSSSEWYNVVWLVLNKYEQTPNSKKDWDFWLLLIACLERQVFISFAVSTTASQTGGATETANLLFNFDQYLHKVTQLSDKFRVQKDLVNMFLDHYRGQLLLHAASLIFKRELLQNKNKWKETVKSTLPLLLMAYQCEAYETKEPWMKHCDEQEKQLLQLWHREGAFRCAQAGRILLSCIADETADKENANSQINKVLGNQQILWSNNDALLAQIRQTCGDKQWRRNVFALLFCNSDHKVKEQSSLIIKSPKLNEPHFDLPTYSDVERYEEAAQYLKPQSLQHMVYLCIGNNNLSYVRVKYFSVLNFSTQNLSFCGAESLNQLDIETFLYAATLQAKRMLDVDRDAFESYNSERSAVGKPRILSFVNLQGQLCTEEQSGWWTAAYQVYKNLSSENLAELRANLQFGIEAVRGINGPKIDMMIVFKLGQIFVARAQDIVKPIEKAYLEARAENIFKYGLNMMKMHNKGVLEPFRKYFKYAKSNTSAVERELASAAEDAVSYLATRYFKKAEYEELIDELAGIQLPFATYLQAEAYRKMDEANKTPKKAKRMYLDRATDCLTQTLQLLKSTQTDPNHPLNSIIHSELKRVQQASNRFASDGSSYSPITSGSGGASGSGLHNNSSAYEDAESDFFSDNSTALNINRNRREAAAAAAALIASPRNIELENLVKQLTTTLTFVKEEICEFIKPKILSISKEVTTLKDQISSLEDAMKKTRITSNPPSRDDASNVLDDLYMIEDALQNQMYQQSNQSHLPAHYTTSATAMTGVGSYGHQQQQQQRIHTPNATMQQMQQNAAAAAVAAAVYNNPMLYAGNSTMNYYTQPQYMMPQGANGSAVLGQRNPLSLPYMDPAGGMNYNLAPTTPLLPPPNQDPQRAPTNLYGLLTQQNASTPPQQSQLIQQQQPLPPPLQQPPQPQTLPIAMPPLQLTAASVPTSIAGSAVVPPAMAATPPVAVASTIQFNKALNNQPVEKGPPANVVITSSDPLPNPNTAPLQTQQPTLSVTIPPHHIKSSLASIVASINDVATATASTQPIAPFTNLTLSSNTAPAPVFSGFGSSTGPSPFSTAGVNKTSPFVNNANLVNPVTAVSPSTFSFKPQIAQAAKNADESLNKTNESASSEQNKSAGAGDAEVEYDPRPDFKPIIALPDEIEVKTGEEDEEVMFCHRSKLFRFVDKEWKERGIGDIKILKNTDGTSRILMRREQTHKICANHKITKELVLTSHKNETKGWIWAAHDFADEELKYEKFLIRFKSPETAQKFGEAFRKAQEDAKKTDEDAMPPPIENKVASVIKPPIQFGLAKSGVTNFATSTPSTKSDATNLVKPISVGATSNSTATTETSSGAVTSTVSKTLFGFSVPNPTTAPPAAKPSTTTASPFANFTFGKMTTATTDATAPPVFSSSPFANIFSDLSKSQVSPFNTSNITTTAVTTEPNALNKSSTSDAEEEYVPTAQFNPVIPLPNLIEVTTGEENELVLFEHRAKLLRYDKEAGEWKERGIGNIKILQDKSDVNKVRLVMRREQIHKLCCNQRLYKDTLFKYAKNSETALTWAGQDFSENELVTELLTVRFKTKDICRQFHEAIMKAQANMSSEAKEDNVRKQKDAIAANKEAANGVKNVKDSKDKTNTIGFGDAFKPKAGSWSCQACYTSNAADKNYCLACENPKDDTIPKKEPVSILKTSSAFSFKFGTNVAATGNATSTTNVNSVDVTKSVFGLGNTATPKSSGFGDKFKPKEGAWPCPGCYVSNKSDALYCMACETPKDDTIPKKEAETHDILALSDPTKKFTFGFAATPTASTEKISNAPAKGFMFGTTPTATKSEPAKTTFGVIGNAAGNSEATKSYEFTLPSATSTTLASSLSSISKPTFSFSLQSKAMDAPAMPTSGGGEAAFGSEYTSSFKPKSPLKFGFGGGDADAVADDADVDGEHDHVEEENNTYFTPVIPLPEKIDVKTGEENEETLYVHRAKLYRFIESEWKERGVGDVKILRHRETKKLRVVMRRDQVHKICLNHVLNDDVKYKRKDDKSWLFVANDFSEGEVELEKFSLRFLNKEVAEGFMDAVKSALSGTAIALETNSPNVSRTSLSATSNEDQNVSDAHKQMADRLHLPIEFFDTKPNCTGCRGCESESFVFSTPKTNDSFVHEDDIKNPLLPLELPLLTICKKNRSLLKQTVFSTPTSGNSKETSSKIGEGIFSGFVGPNSTVFGSGADKSAGVNKTFSFAAALNSTTGTGAQQNESKSLFSGAGGAEGIFGGDKKSIFANNSTFNSADKMTPIFGSGSISGEVTEGGSIFGGKPVFGGFSAVGSGTKSIFGNSNSTQSAGNGTGNSIFGTTTSPFSVFGASNKSTTQTSIFGSGGLNTASTNSIFDNSKKDGAPPAAVATSTLAAPSFADLSTKAGGIDFASLAAKASAAPEITKLTEKPSPGGFIGLTNTDAFSSFLKPSNNNNSLKNTSATSDGNANDSQNAENANNEENFDPHFEPIIALPQEIVVSTGEEEETKLFGERATLFRWDDVNKEWKERGVGELKILLHPTHQTYRMILRREQIHKLVLNFGIGAEFSFSNMNNNPKSFVWAGLNYAESATDGVLEKLAVRFKKVDLAEQFSAKLKECIEAAKKRKSGAV